MQNSVQQSILHSEALEGSLELTEVALDQLLADSFLKEIPILGTFLKTIHTGIKIRDYFFARKIIKFLTALQNLSRQEIDNFEEKLKQDREFAHQTGEQLIFILDRLDNLDKPELIAKVFRAYLKGKIDSSTFWRLCSAIERVFIDDLTLLMKSQIYTDKHPLYEKLLNSGLTKLVDRVPVSNNKKDVSLTFFHPFSASPFNSNNARDSIRLKLEISELGECFIKIMTEKI